MNTKERGSNITPKLQKHSVRPSALHRRITSQVKILLGVKKLTAEQRSAVAFLITPLKREERKYPSSLEGSSKGNRKQRSY